VQSGFWEIIGGVMTGAIIGAMSEHVRMFVFGPRIRIFFHVKEYGRMKTVEHHRNEAQLVSAGIAPGQPGQEVNIELSHFVREVVYVRLRVKNGWFGTLEKCRAYLVDIERELGNRRFERAFFDSVSLKWSNIIVSDQTAIDIPRGVEFNLDVLSTRKGSDSYLPSLAAIPNCYETLFKEHGTFRWTIAVTADNAKPQLCKLRLRWSGLWDAFEVEEIPDRDW